MTADVTTRSPINVLDPAFYVDPWDAYRWLREEAPVFWDPGAEALGDLALRRHHRGRGRRRALLVVRRVASPPRPARGPVDHQHGRPRAPAATEPRRRAGSRPGRSATTRSTCAAICREILDDVAPRGECEAIEAIASRLPAIMIGDLLGYPRELWERVRHWSEQIMLLAGQTSPDGPPHESHPGLGPVIQEFFEVTIPIVKERQADPARRPHLGLGHHRGLGHRPRPRRDDPRAQRRRRDHPHGDRVDDPRARPPARPAPAAARPPGAGVDDRGRGVHPVGDAGAQHAPDGHRRPRAPRPATPRRRRDPPAVRSGEPRPAGVRRPRRAQRRPCEQAARRVRVRDALLPRRARGAARDPGDVRGAAAADPPLGARRPRRAEDHARHVRRAPTTGSPSASRRADGATTTSRPG